MVQLMPLPSPNPSSLALFKSRLVVPFWYWLTQVVLEKRLLNRWSSSSCCLLSEWRDPVMAYFFVKRAICRNIYMGTFYVSVNVIDWHITSIMLLWYFVKFGNAEKQSTSVQVQSTTMVWWCCKLWYVDVIVDNSCSSLHWCSNISSSSMPPCRTMLWQVILLSVSLYLSCWCLMSDCHVACCLYQPQAYNTAVQYCTRVGEV